jgi:hypothetical protein
MRRLRVLALCLGLALPAGSGVAAAAWTATTSTSSGSFAAASAFPPVVTAIPDVLGVAQDGQLLEATGGSFSPAPTSRRYAWLRCDASGGACTTVATTSSYLLTPGDTGSTLRVQVTPVNGTATGDPVRSLPTQVSAPLVNLAPVLLSPPSQFGPAISGTPAVGQPLSASIGTWAITVVFSRRWQRCDALGAACQDIAGATGATYVPTAADRGLRLRVVVSAAGVVTNTTATAATARVA